jgi:hypothetical protein
MQALVERGRASDGMGPERPLAPAREDRAAVLALRVWAGRRIAAAGRGARALGRR